MAAYSYVREATIAYGMTETSPVSTQSRGKIGTFKIARYWKFTDAFPITVTGKVQKFRMREIAIAELGLQDAAAIRTA